MELFHLEEHWNHLSFFLIAQNSLCLDWKELTFLFHTPLGVKSLPLEGFPDGFKCFAEAVSDV